MATIFYTPCAAGELIAKRKAIYNQETRDSDSYLWLYKKMASAFANAGGASLQTPKGAGFPSRTNKKSVYTTTNSDTLNTARNLIPKPHLVSIKTSYAGDFGSVQKCEIAFTVYSLAQLNACQGFFTINAPVYAGWGWTNAGKAGGKGVTFSGNVVNFSWSINSSGGADCTCSAIGKGVNTLSVNANLLSSDQNVKYKTGTLFNEQVYNVTSVLEKLRYDIYNESLNIDQPINIPAAGSTGYVGVINAPSVFKKPEDPPSRPPLKDTSKPNQLYYVSLGLIVYEFNQSLAKYTNINSRLKIDAANGGVCQMPEVVKEWASSNPTECIFPGMSNYGTLANGVTQILEFNGALSNIYSSGKVQNVGYIMIEIEYLHEVMKSLGVSTDKGERSPSKTLNDFFKKIFTMIDSNSGGAIKLSTAVNPKNQNEILIIETQYIPDEITPTEIPAVTQNSICRSMSLTAKVPSELQVVASVSANSGTGNVNPAPLSPFLSTEIVQEEIPTNRRLTVGDVFTLEGNQTEIAKLNAQNSETLRIMQKDATQLKDLPEFVAIFSGEDSALEADFKQQLEYIKYNNEKIANLETETANLLAKGATPLAIVYLLGPKPELVTAARTYLRTISKPINASIVYPLDFSFTIDGIAGIKFGDAVTTNYMPVLYKQKKNRCSFTVLSVEHNVSGNDWTTTCTTVFRMRP